MLVQVLKPGSEHFAAYLALRYAVLRAPLGMPPGSEQDALDGPDVTGIIHLALVDGEEVVACARLQPDGLIGQARLRYMAVAPVRQGRGLGRRLLQAMVEEAEKAGVHTISLLAREGAVPFYKACGYVVVEEGAPLLGIRHWRMEKGL